MKHSKGKWEVYTAIPDENSRIKIKSDDIIAVGYKKEGSSGYTAIAFCGYKKNEEGKANAKLIAAAPDLLEAAIKLQEWQTKYPAGRVYPYGMANAIESELTAIVNMQLDAIKKATE